MKIGAVAFVAGALSFLPGAALAEPATLKSATSTEQIIVSIPDSWQDAQSGTFTAGGAETEFHIYMSNRDTPARWNMLIALVATSFPDAGQAAREADGEAVRAAREKFDPCTKSQPKEEIRETTLNGYAGAVREAICFPDSRTISASGPETDLRSYEKLTNVTLHGDRTVFQVVYIWHSNEIRSDDKFVIAGPAMAMAMESIVAASTRKLSQTGIWPCDPSLPERSCERPK